LSNADPNPIRDLPLVLTLSLCSSCEKQRIVRSGKGSVFLMCQLGLEIPAWPKYPPQPIQACRNYQKLAAQEDVDAPK
jgi:hypothetical protein